MAKSEKEKKVTGKTNPAPDSSEKKESSKPKKIEEDDDDDDDDALDEVDEVPVAKKGAKAASTSKKKSDEDDDDDAAGEDAVDDWEKVEEDEDWDPDFDEFDIPKSKGKKGPVAGPAGKKPAAEEDDDFKVDDEFKDMFGDSDSFEEEEEDY